MPQRATGNRAEAKRALLLDAAEKVMVEQGAAAVTSRSIGAEAEVPAPLVHYYFPTLDDLFVALLQRGAERSKERVQAVLDGPDPLRGLWELNLDPRGTSTVTELLALSKRRTVLGDAIAELVEQHRTLYTDAIAELFERSGVDTETFPPELVAIAISGISRVIVREQAMGVSAGHEEALAAIDRLITRASANPV